MGWRQIGDDIWERLFDGGIAAYARIWRGGECSNAEEHDSYTND